MRGLITGLVAIACVLVVGPVGLLVAWATGSARPLYALAIPCARLVLRLAGTRLTVTGRERLDPAQTYVFVANHLSNIDPPLMLVAIGRDIRALGKASLFRLPIFGAVLRTAGFPPVHRNDRERAIAAVDIAAEGLRQGHDFLVFAEGTRSTDGRLGTFKKGPFVMAIKAAVPVVPTVIRGTRDMLPKGSTRLRAGRVAVEFLEPVPTSGMRLDDRTRLRDRVHTVMSKALDDGTADAGDRHDAIQSSVPDCSRLH